MSARSVPFAAAAVILCNALFFCGYAVLSPGEIHALVAPSIIMMTAAALLLPWGVRPQAIVSAVCVLTYLGALELAGRHTELATLYGLVSLFVAAAASCVGAYMIEQRSRLAEQQTQRLREMNQLMSEASIRRDESLASVSHELRTPLNVVFGYVDLLLDNAFGPLEPAQREILSRITNSASSLSRLIDDLIDFSRIEAGRLRVEVGVVDLSPLFADLSNLMELLLAGHDVEFKADIAAGCTGVRADPDRLKQILSNLLVNAVKFTERGSIALRAEPHQGGLVAFSVADTGIGIPLAAHKAIFEPFRQVHDRGKRVPGAGIGLYISSRLAHLMGGSLGVESELGRGSRFTLVVPAATRVANAPSGPAAILRKVS